MFTFITAEATPAPKPAHSAALAGTGSPKRGSYNITIAPNKPSAIPVQPAQLVRSRNTSVASKPVHTGIR